MSPRATLATVATFASFGMRVGISSTLLFRAGEYMSARSLPRRATHLKAAVVFRHMGRARTLPPSIGIGMFPEGFQRVSPSSEGEAAQMQRRMR